MGSEPDSDRERTATDLFVDFLVRRDAGEDADFEALCADHRAHEAELRSLERKWQQVEGALGRVGMVGPVSERIRELHGSDVDPAIELSAGEEPRTDVLSDVVERLGGRQATYGRYRLEGEVARGGQGAILRVWDEDLRRHLAMKVVLGSRTSEDDGSPSPSASKTLGRFLEEAQITAQLDHPGIVPVHELGLDSQGRVYFTMKLVKGRNLRKVFGLVKRGEEGWTRTRALGVLLRVCEAVSYAHARGVVHRDLKPGNVMVGAYGEVYVMDWGLARILGRDSKGDDEVLHSDRQERASPEAPLLTVDGDVVGTPGYMPPEQAQGRLADIGPTADVYAVGAMLYHLLAGHMPYAPPGTPRSGMDVWALLKSGPPEPIHRRAPDAPGELVAICEKAMARRPDDRYADMTELAEDLRAFLEHRVVRAHRTGAAAELGKWIERNRGLATASGAAIAAALVGLAAVGYVQSEGRTAAEAEREIARAERDNVLRLSAFQDLEDLRTEAEGLWPAHPDRAGDMRAWLTKAREVIAGLHASTDGEDLGHLARLADLETRIASPDGARDEDRWWHAQLVKLVREIEALAHPDTGLVDGVGLPHGWGVARRLAFAESVESITVTGEAARARWDAAIAAVADVDACPWYGGLRLEPMLGLIPLGPDPDSGLWEFAHLASGEEPRRGADGRLVLTERTGLVLVLVPGGTYPMGAQGDDPAASNYDPLADPDWGPVHEVTLSPFLLSKYEMTQGQWLRFTGKNPSMHGPGTRFGDVVHDLTHPVEQVSWETCERVLARLGLEFPTEAQWEYGARAGTTTTWWVGDDVLDLAGAANLADASAVAQGVAWSYFEEWDDGYASHAPVGTFAANAFGLHDVLGNVWEWCRDGYDADFYGRSPSVDPLRTPEGQRNRVTRGGGYYLATEDARSALRSLDSAEILGPNLGLRPARSLSP